MKSVPFSKAQIEKLSETYLTPFYIYDEEGIRAQVRKLLQAFSWNKGFKQHFAVKALPNPEILKIMKAEKCGLDCSSLPELLLAKRAGIEGKDIVFTSNNTAAEEFVAAKKAGTTINLDDIKHLDFLEKHAGLPDLISFRYTPLLEGFGNAIIGNPRDSKYGLTREQLFEAYDRAKEKGVRRFGFHAMPISNELNVDTHLQAVRELFSTAAEIQKKLGVTFEFINVGGGIGIPYRPEDEEFYLDAYVEGVQRLAQEHFGEKVPAIHMECGRYITGPFGYLVSRVRHVKESYKKYVGLDATMANLMRPGMYGAYHHVTVLGKENSPATAIYDVVGSLCENNDKFAINRELPEIEPGDLLVIHDAGAHGHAMGFNYNGKLRSAEFLMQEDGTFKMIRRAETIEDYFATLNY